MQVDGAVIKEQGVTFAVVVVKRSALQTQSQADALIRQYSQQLFDGLPTVLMAQDSRGVPTYMGRRDLVGFLASVPVGTIPWKRYTFT
jgi:hypothetical protein